MIFLALIAALLLLQAWGSGSRVQSDGWYEGWRTRVAAMALPAPLILALAVLAPAALVQLALDAIEPLLFGLVWIAASTILLLYSFGRGDFQELLERYRSQCAHGDFEGAFLTTLSELDWATVRDDPGSPKEVHALVQRGFAYDGYQRLFAVLFYFLLLGPAAALAYRLLQLGRHHFEAELTERCLFWLDWIPARLLAATFALAGDFVRSRDELVHGLLDGTAEAGDLLHRVALAACGAEPPLSGSAGFGERAAEQNRELSSLLRRSAVCWVGIISLLVLLL